MEFKLIWMCLSNVLLSLVAAEFEGGNTEAEYTEVAEEIAIDPVLQAPYKTPQPTGEVYFSQTFDDGTMNGWVLSNAKKEDTDDEIAKYDGRWETEGLKSNQITGDKGLVLKSAAKHHAIAAMLSKPFVFDDRPLIVQYEVNFQNGIDCGGAYIKLLSVTEHLNLEEFYDKTPYTIMFGPDKCGEDYKMHFIFNHKNPKTGYYEEKHAKRPEIDLKTYFTDMKTHLYTLVLKPDNTFEMLIDQKIMNKGHLLEDMIPPVNPPKEIEDPDDRKPEEWDEELRIPDPNAVKPEDWNETEPESIEDPDAVKPEGWLNDEPEYIPDPNAEKPQDWFEESNGEWAAEHVPNPKCESAPGCGEWTPPMIANPSYKGKWIPPMVENPNYQGKWSPRRIPNPNYFEDQHPFKMTSFTAIGLELWSMTSDIYFDNFIICSEKGVADQWAYDSWSLKKLVAIANEPSIFVQLWNSVEENPWVWISCLISGVPLVLLVLFFRSRKKKDEIVLDQSTDELRPATTGALEGAAKEETQKEGPVPDQFAEICPRTKGALEAVTKEETQNEDDDSKSKVEQEASRKECENEQKQEEEEDAGEDSQPDTEEDGGTANNPASGDEIIHANGDVMSENGPQELLHKRRVQRD